MTNKSCTVEGCERPHSGKGLCALHYARMHRLGRVELAPRAYELTCTVDGCDRPQESHGFCATHARRFRKHGDPLVVGRGGTPRTGRPTVLRGGYLMDYAPEHPLASRSGQVLQHRRVLFDLIGSGSHPCHECGRLVEWGVKSKRDRLEVDHLDGNRANNDPANLAPSCNRCNDGQANRRAAACAAGHEYTPENTYVHPVNGSRRCRECMREHDRRRVRR